MGMDVSGVDPTTKEGEYFRNNVWWWHPLADYCLQVGGDVAKKCEYWHSNDGDGLDAEGSLQLAELLEAEVTSGRCEEFAKKRDEKIKALPKKPCWLCGGTGIRTDPIGVNAGFPEMICESGKRKGQKGWCNSCDGDGELPDSATHYPFDVQNVQVFITFLKGCGGFKIY